MTKPVLTPFDQVLPYLPPAIEITPEDLEELDPRERTFEQIMEDETGKPAFGPL